VDLDKIIWQWAVKIKKDEAENAVKSILAT
jgi:hypothetical protein